MHLFHKQEKWLKKIEMEPSRVPFCERSITKYEIDSSSFKNVNPERQSPGFAEIEKMFRWLTTGKPLDETGNPMELAVVPKWYPYTKFNEFEGKKYMKKLNPTKKELFVGTRLERGAIIFTCASEASKSVLKDAVPQLTTGLEVGPADIICHGIKFVFCTYLGKGIGSDRILQLIEMQNKAISTKQWNVVERSEFSFTVWVDNRSLNLLRAHSLKLDLGKTQIEFRPLLNFAKINQTRMNSEPKLLCSPEGHIGMIYQEHFMQSCNKLSNLIVVTFGLQLDEKKSISEARKQRLRKLLEKQASQRVIPFRERLIIWYQLDINTKDSIKCKSEYPLLPELYRIYRQLRFGARLNEKGNTMEMAIVLEGYPYIRMTQSQADKACKMINPSNENRFVATRYENGAVIVTCPNEAAKIVLKDTIAKLGSKLEVGSADILRHGVKFIFYTYFAKEMGTEEILEAIEAQNERISTKEWSVVERSEFSLTVWIDNKTFNTLMENNFELWIKFSKVEFMPLVSFNKIKLTQSPTEEQLCLNVAAHSGPTHDKDITDMPNQWSVTFGLQIDEDKILFQEKGSKRRRKRKKRPGEIILIERSIIWYKISGSSTNPITDDRVKPHLSEFYKVYKWLTSGKPLAESGKVKKVAVVLEGYPYVKISNAQSHQIYRMINITDNSKFNGFKCKNGAIILKAPDESSKKWLKERVTKFRQNIFGKLEVGPADITVHGIKLIILLDLSMKYMTIDKILDLIETHNLDISTSEWGIVERKELSITVWVDIRTLNILKLRRLKLTVGQHEVEFRPLVHLDKMNRTKELCDIKAKQTAPNFPERGQQVQTTEYLRERVLLPVVVAESSSAEEVPVVSACPHPGTSQISVTKTVPTRSEREFELRSSTEDESENDSDRESETSCRHFRLSQLLERVSKPYFATAEEESDGVKRPTTEEIPYQHSSLSELLQQFSKPYNATELREEKCASKVMSTAGEASYKYSSLSQLLESVRKPYGSSEFGARQFHKARYADEASTLGSANSNDQSLSQFLHQRVSKPCSSAQLDEELEGDLESVTTGETEFKDSSLSEMLERMSKTLHSSRSHKRSFSDLEPETVGSYGFKFLRRSFDGNEMGVVNKR